jgi:small subunit ribosomal protein S6
MRLYDIVVLVSADLSEEDAGKLAGDYKKILTDGGAEIVKDEPWGRRRLAFPILRKKEAYYHYVQVTAEPPVIAELERRLKLSDQVLRHLAVRADEELKRAAKSAEKIKAKALKRPPRPAPVPAAGAESTASGPGPASGGSAPVNSPDYQRSES